MNDNAHNPQHDPGGEPENNSGKGRKEQFNELSELSLEERMKVADQLGVPVYNAGDAAATGTMRGGDEADSNLNEGNENTDMRTAT